jgi:membrane protease YdiL (CAAX protease family)
MDFTLKKPAHLLALLGVLGSLLLFVVYPLISLAYPTQIPAIYNPLMTPFQKLTIELSLLFVQLLFVFTFLLLVPLLWYRLVNHLSFKEMFDRLQLRRQGIDQAILWGIVTVAIAFAATMAFGLLYMYFTKINPSDLSNIPDLQQMFSTPSLYLLVTVQPFCEEFFFRGFLLEKMTHTAGKPLAVVSTAVLFGISHLTYTYAYAAVIAVILGVLFALVVLRTKNLYTSIFAHTVINVTSLTIYFFGKSFGM